MKIFDIRFSMDLHVLRCPEHDLTDFRKCLSICRPEWMSQKYFWHGVSRNNVWKLMKLYIQLNLNIIWHWLEFGTYRSRSFDVVRNYWFFFNTVVYDKFRGIVPYTNCFKQTFWILNYLFKTAIALTCVIFVYMGAVPPIKGK